MGIDVAVVSFNNSCCVSHGYTLKTILHVKGSYTIVVKYFMSIVHPFFRVGTGIYTILIWVFSLWCCVREGLFVLLCPPHPTILFISSAVMMSERLSWIIHIFLLWCSLTTHWATFIETYFTWQYILLSVYYAFFVHDLQIMH